MRFQFSQFERLADSILSFIKSQPPDLYKIFPRGRGWETIFEAREVTNDLELFAAFCAAGFVENTWNPPRTFRVTPLFIHSITGNPAKVIDDIIATYRSFGYKKTFDFSHLHRILFETFLHKKIEKYGEIGSHVGGSMSFVAKANKDVRIFCYDLPNGHSGGQAETDFYLRRARDTFAPGRCELYFGDSHSNEMITHIARNAPYDVFLIDGDHTATGCKADFNVVLPLVKKGGMIIIDDLAHHPKLERLFDSIISDYGIRKWKKIMELEEADKTLNLCKRGVGILYV